MAKADQKVHFVGIKGVGMAALAIVAKEMGYAVTGSDVAESFVTDEELVKAGIVVLPFDVKNIKERPDFVVVSAAYDKDNVEVKEARKRHLEIKTYSEFLGLISSNYQVIAVAGIHGKTTTTALVSFLLKKANLDPSFVIGSGKIPSLGGLPAHLGTGEYFVLEADEYRKSPQSNEPKFLDLTPTIEIITSVEMDHPDFFPTEEKVYDAFYKFAIRTPRTGFIVLCSDYPKAKKILRSLVDRNFQTYGFEDGAAWQIKDFKEGENSSSFNIEYEGKILGPFEQKIPGRANALNATAAIIIAIRLKVGEQAIKKYLPQFSGVKRRFEKIGEKNNLIIIDDYAHHPRAIKTTLEAARQRFPNRKVWCIFEPHTYSRTKELLMDFAHAFSDADKIIIAKIFASAREKEATISGDDLAVQIRNFNKQVKYIESSDEIISEIIDNLSGPTVLLTIGAGDVYKLGPKILAKI